MLDHKARLAELVRFHENEQYFETAQYLRLTVKLLDEHESRDCQDQSSWPCTCSWCKVKAALTNMENPDAG